MFAKLKNPGEGFSFAFANIFKDPWITVLVTSLPERVRDIPVTERLVRTSEEIHERLFGYSKPEDGLLRTSYELLTRGADSTRDAGQRAYVVMLSENDPIHKMDPWDARNTAFNMAMIAAAASAAEYNRLHGVDPTASRHFKNPMALRTERDPERQIILSQIELPAMEARRFTYSDCLRRTRTMLTEDALNGFIDSADSRILGRINSRADAIQNEVSASVITMFYEMQYDRENEYARSMPAAPGRTPEDPGIAKVLSRAENAFRNLGAESRLETLDIDQFEYPNAQISENFGLPQNTEYDYVSSAFLNGIMNYGSNYVAFMVGRYGLGDDEHLDGLTYFESMNLQHGPKTLERVRQQYQEHACKVFAQPHVKFSGDDWLLYFETPNSYIFMYLDNDVSDCSVTRYSKDSCALIGIHSMETFVYESLLKHLKHAVFFQGYSGLDEHVIVQAPGLPSGWLQF